MQGLSLGWSDEINGVMGGTGYALGSLNKNWNKTGESTKEAFKRGYIKARDERRNLLEQGYQKSPTAMTIMESAGAIGSPANKLFSASKNAPLRIKDLTTRKGAIATGVIYGAGSSKNKASDYAKNIAASTFGNTLGYKTTKQIQGRAGSPIMHGLINEAIAWPVKKSKNLLEDKE